MWTVVIVLIAVFVGAAASIKFSIKTLSDNRAKEWPENETTEPLSQSALHWTVVHIRDDIGGIHNILIITNGLLAGVLAALALQLIR